MTDPYDDDPDACITPACGRRYHGANPVRHGLRVCGHCADEMLDALTEIPDRWQDVDDPEMIHPQKGDPGRRSKGGPAGAPVNLTYFALFDERTMWVEPGDLVHPVDALGGYRDRVLDALAGRTVEIGSAEELLRRHHAGGSVSSVCRAIAQHGNLALRQDWAGFLCWAVRLVRDEVRSITGAARPARPIGFCPQLLDRWWCGYPLWLPPPGGTIECGGCGHTWTKRDWLHLGDRMGLTP